MPDRDSLKILKTLEAVAIASLETRLARMFDGADDLLFDMAKGAVNNSEQRTYFDSMRIIRLNRQKISRIFLGQIGLGFAPPVVASKNRAAYEPTYDNLGLQEVQTLERAIAVSNMATKAEGLYKSAIWEIESRLDTLIRKQRLALSAQMLSPTAICEAFRVSSESIDCEFAVGLVVYKLFDRVVISDLAGMYSDILSFLKDYGIKAELSPANRASTTSAPSPRMADSPEMVPTFENPGHLPNPGQAQWQADAAMSAASAAQAALFQQALQSSAGPLENAQIQPLGRSAGYAPPKLDPQTQVMLSRIEAQIESQYDQPQISPEARPYTDARLAHDLASAATGKLVSGWSEPQAMAYLQRTRAVSEMFNQILADPNMPSTLKPQFDDLRFVVTKTALRDVSFFANPKHPIRGLLNELGELATSARAAGPEMLAQVRMLVSQIQSQFDIAAETVRSPGSKPEPLRDEQIAAFLEQQSEQYATRRQALVGKARRVVTEELQLRSAGRAIPAEARELLNSGWGPMLGMRLMRHGVGTDAWNGGLQLLDRIIEAVDPQSPESRSAESRAALSQELSAAFVEIGMSDQRIHNLLEGLDEIFRKIDAELVQAAAHSAASTPTSEAATALPMHSDSMIHPIEPPLAANSPRALKLLVNASLSENSPDQAGRIDANAILDLLIVPGAWFHVYDHRQQGFRWLKSIAYYSIRDTVAFAEFNGKNTLFVKSKLFFSDLAAGRIRPLDLSPMSRRAVDVFLASGLEHQAPPAPQNYTMPISAVSAVAA